MGYQYFITPVETGNWCDGGGGKAKKTLRPFPLKDWILSIGIHHPAQRRLPEKSVLIFTRWYKTGEDPAANGFTIGYHYTKAAPGL